MYGHVARADKSQDYFRALQACISPAPRNWRRRPLQVVQDIPGWERWRKICANSILVSHQGFAEHKIEQLGEHSEEQQRHRQAPKWFLISDQRLIFHRSTKFGAQMLIDAQIIAQKRNSKWRPNAIGYKSSDNWTSGQLGGYKSLQLQRSKSIQLQ